MAKAPAVTDIPGASVYAQAIELAKKRYQTRLADINKQRQGLFRQSGFTGNIDEKTGLVTNQRIDPYSKYGQIQQLYRSHAKRYDEMTGTNIERGLGTGGGLAAQELGDLRYDFGKETSEFGANPIEQLSGLTRQQQDELYAYEQALWESQHEAAQSAISAGDYGYVPDGGGDYDYPEDPGLGSDKKPTTKSPYGQYLGPGMSYLKTVSKTPIVTGPRYTGPYRSPALYVAPGYRAPTKKTMPGQKKTPVKKRPPVQRRGA